MAPAEPVDPGPQIVAAAEAFGAFTALGRRGCLIGGLALQRWGQPRFTQDADLTVLAPFGSEQQIVDELLGHLMPRHPWARAHAIDRRVLLLTASNGVSLDISLAALSFEHEVLQRASRWRQVQEIWLETCSAEDLDIARIRNWSLLFAELKEDPDLLRPFEEALR